MTIILFIVLIIVVVIIPIIIITRRNRKIIPLNLNEIGTIIDRSIASYRRNLLPLLALSALSVPLGNISNSNMMALLLLNMQLPYETSSTLMRISESFFIMSTFSIFGIGQMLLTCAIVHAMYTSKTGTIRLANTLPRERLAAVAGMVGLMVVISAVSRFLSVIGILIMLYCAIAPVVLFYEQLSPSDALKRSIGIVRPQLSGIVNVLVPLWVIGWLVTVGPLFGTLALFAQMITIPPDIQSSLIIIAWLSGNIFVEPLLVLGVLHFYLYMCERPDDIQASGIIARIVTITLLVVCIVIAIGVVFVFVL